MHHARLQEMTFTALNNRADETVICDTVADYTGTDPGCRRDLREVTVFMTHEQDDLGEDYGYRLHAKEVIGVALCDLDDPSPCRKSSTGIRRGRCSGGTSSKIGSASNDHR